MPLLAPLPKSNDMRKIMLLCLCGLAITAQASEDKVLVNDLMSTYLQALYADPNLKVAELQFGLSEAQRAQAGGALLPQISANINISYNDRDIQQSGRNRGERYSVGLTQSLIDVAKIYNWKRYQSLTDKFNQDYVQAQQVLMHDVVERYFSVLAGQDSLKLVQQEISVTKRQLKQLRRQYEKRVVKVTDVYELEANLDALKADAIESETAVDIAKQQLMELTGQRTNNLARLRNDIQFTIIPGDILALTEQAQLNSPLIKAQENEVLAADYNLIGQHAKHLPSVDLQLQYYGTDTGFQNSQVPFSNTMVAAVNITIPIFAGGATYQSAQEAARQLDISRQKKISLLRSIEKETRDAFLSANASVRRIKASNKALQTAIKARKAMEKGLMYGMKSMGDVLISQEREFSAKRDLLVSKYAYILNRIRFQRASGALSPESLEEINQWLEHN